VRVRVRACLPLCLRLSSRAFVCACAKVRSCNTTQDLKTTLKKLDEDRSFLCMEDKKAEIKQGFKEKKLKAAAAAGSAAPAVDMQQLERDADAKVINLKSKRQTRRRNPTPLRRFQKCCGASKPPSTKTKAAWSTRGVWWLTVQK